MSKIISGVLLPAGDGAEPMPIPVTDLGSITKLVGGPIDAVTCKFDIGKFLEETDRDDEFVAVGYVHDEGLLINLPLNKMATLIFQREIRGPVVLVSGTSPDGDYDGENYDLPEWFCDAVFSGSLTEAISELDQQAMVVADALKRAVSEGLMTQKQANSLVILMGNVDRLGERHMAQLSETVDVIVSYHLGRLMGYPKIDRLFDEDEQEIEDIQWSPSDEEIAKFLEESEGM